MSAPAAPAGRWPPGPPALPWALLALLLLLGAAAWLLRPGVPPAPRPGPGTFAQLLTQNVLLENGTLRWHSDPGLRGVFLSPGLRYDEERRQLVVSEAGVYYVYLQLALSRKLALRAPVRGQVSLTLYLEATATPVALTVDLSRPCSARPQRSARSFLGHLLDLAAGQRLSVRLKAEAAAQRAWQLAQNATILGLVRTTREDAGKAFPPGAAPSRPPP